VANDSPGQEQGEPAAARPASAKSATGADFDDDIPF
jgi:hypothetical protein